jgi:hypothetical protein
MNPAIYWDRSDSEPPIPPVRSAREDWSALTPNDQVDVYLYRRGTAFLDKCSLRAQAYIRRHGQA